VQAIVGILALLIAAVGWYYLFYSRAADRLGSIEEQETNRKRGLLRRVNAIVMLLMAVGIAAGTYRYHPDTSRDEWIATWTAVMLLLPISVVLALIDVRLTMKLRDQLRERNKRT
jgi:uncharacterized BrkB/YihY/UPF0761 family membrane protein